MTSLRRMLARSPRARSVRARLVKSLGGQLPVAAPPQPDAVEAVDAAETPDDWFWSHYRRTPHEIMEFLGGEQISLEGKHVADIGCGDGIIDLGLARAANPAMLVGFDLNAVDVDHLRRQANDAGVDDTLPSNLEFRTSSPERLNADDASFDVVITWSAFEHIGDPGSILREIHRILRPDGLLFLQLWPFYYSEHGAHLEEWISGFDHLVHDAEWLATRARSSISDPGWVEYKLKEFDTLNKITLDELAGEIVDSSFHIGRVELMSHTIRVPEQLQRTPLTKLLTAGVMLIATPVKPD